MRILQAFGLSIAFGLVSACNNLVPPPAGSDAGPTSSSFGGRPIQTGDGGQDGGEVDAGPADAGPVDAGPVDAGAADAGADAGPPLVANAIDFVGVVYPTPSQPFMGVDYSASYTINPVATFVFQVVDATGKAGVPGVPVQLSIDSATSQLGAQLEATTQCPNLPSCTTDAEGKVAVALHSGHQAGAVTVSADMTLSDGTVASATGSSNVVGTQPSVTNSSLTCGPVNLAAFAGQNTPCNSSSNQSLKTSCTVSLADRFGNAIGIQVPVELFTEAGTLTQGSVDTPAYGATGQVPPGVATDTLTTTGNNPVDVSPLPASLANPNGEPSWSGSCAGVQRTYNPRDGLVTVIAVFSGEEPFEDDFGTGAWAAGDPWVDMPQPFVDSNDNSVWDPGEKCVGAAGLNGCTPPNHVWDGNASVFVESRLLFTGDPEQNLTTWNPTTFTVTPSSPVLGTVTFPDIDLNTPSDPSGQASSGQGTIYSVSVFGSSCQSPPSVAYPAPNFPANPGDTLGMKVVRLGLPNSGNPACDGGYVEIDGGQQPNTYCTFLTEVYGFSGGFTGDYKVTENSGCGLDGGTVALQATGQSQLDTNVDQTLISGQVF